MGQSTSATKVARAAAAATGSAVASSSLNCNESADGWLAVDIDLTIGNAASVVITPQVTGGSPATDADYRAVTDPGALTMTATGKKTFSFRCGGWKHARVLVQGTGGDYTGSSVAVSFRYLTRVGV